MRPVRAVEPALTELSSLLEQDFAGVPALANDPYEPDLVPGRLWDQALLDPLRDFLQRPGKRFRERLVAGAFRMAGGRGEPPAELPVLVELLHAGSLIVDDIEDESAVRRGAPALHVEHGLARALNAGNWLYFWPQMLIARSRLPDPLRLAIHERVATALLRCHQGQALDVSIDVRELGRDETPGVVKAMSRLKTGGLMELAAACGALAARAEPRVVHALSALGRDVGIGLQMLDDLSGYLSASRAHKAAEDLRLHRPTWIWAWLAEAGEQVDFDAALACLRAATSDEERAPLLAHLRGVARAARPLVRAHFVEATRRVAQLVGESPTLAAVRHELVELEESYVSG